MLNKMDKLKELFIENPEKEYHLRELARILKKSPATISKEVRLLISENFLIFKSERNHSLYKSNTESEGYRQDKIFFNLNNLRKSKLIEFLKKEYNYPEAIILFGSYRKGENNSNSDIDLAVISPIKNEINIKNFEKKLKHNIQLFVFSKKDVSDLKEKNKELLNNILNGIVIYGFWEIFK